MKQFIITFAVILVFICSACSNSGYDPEKCEALSEKVKSQKELTQDDYSDMIDQAQYAIEFIKKETGVDNVKEMSAEDRNNPEIQKAFKYALGFAIVVGFNQDKLDEANKKKMNDITRQNVVAE
ncbi:MAG: hypothetical protein NC097_06060 [Clostridium sp.]|nr:hypothetical protein [Prevotella sp.]MCM1429343.1 hypothetical protein [Clostridium sp.]MCM1475623.1 hypothetical protein [Muribaculaceae bacterium]